MGAFEKFLAKQKKLDVDQIVFPKSGALDAVRPPPSIYKYFSDIRREFFNRPVLRFTQRTALNDPFELMNRWQEFASVGTRKVIADHIREVLGSLISDKAAAIEIFKEQKAKEGVFLGPNEMAFAATLLLTDQGQLQYASAITNAQNQIDRNLDAAMSAISVGAQNAFEKITANLGILSLSETAESPVMWSLYASAGRGFVVELDSRNSFFNTNGESLLRKVHYQNRLAGDFLQNPFSLFLTKHEGYSFEQEWRMIKTLSECEEVPNQTGEKIYVLNIQPGLIKSIIFGYNYDLNYLARDGARLQIYFDPAIKVKWAFADRSTGTIQIRELM